MVAVAEFMADEMMVSKHFNSIRSEYFTSAKNFGALSILDYPGRQAFKLL